MNRILINILLCLIAFSGISQEWKPAGDKIKTQWVEKVDPSNPLPEYPRPNMVRSEWKNLNGLWDYAILPKGSVMPFSFDGKILVPFPVESSLSGVQKFVGEENELWYNRTFALPQAWKNKKVILNFGAVDWKCDVWINDIKIGSHKGGYTPFSLEISPFLTSDKTQKITVRVWDPVDKGFQPRGKQVNKPGGIWYTSVTGIWQTVWLEAVGESHINCLKAVPDMDRNSVSVTAFSDDYNPGDLLEVKVLDDLAIISSGKSAAGQEVLLEVKNARLWSPESPFLYDLEISLWRKGKLIDKVKSYFGMRKISTKRDASGVVRIQLNNKDYFQFGPLDQGWWPDGLYTAPTDEALKFDIIKTKELGFNLIRKHVKVEPARWYYHCDKEGVLVWQDMPSGDGWAGWETESYYYGKELVRNPESEYNFKREWKEIIDFLYSNPSIVCWVPFNEAWGQFKTIEIAEWTKSYDPSRLVNPASGGNFFPVGDILDIHHYPDPKMTLYDGNRVCVLGEYGGLGLAIDKHLWMPDRNWGYVQYKTSEEVTNAYIELAEKLKKLIEKGFSAAIYTQTTDVEIEVNGFMTYDRKLIKMNEEKIRKVNLEICNSLSTGN
jgi:beta-galactosidase/beta-glucuronidase